MSVFVFFFNSDTGVLFAIGLDRTMSLLGMNHNKTCYSCFSPSLSVVFVIGDADSRAESSTQTVAIVNRARDSTAPFNYILSTSKDLGLLILSVFSLCYLEALLFEMYM
jgi:hypothetical protein